MGNTEVDILVIGAGVAGLSAAQVLGKTGYSVYLVEASHRIGGRAYSERLPNSSWFDLGCSYLHEGEINPFTNVAKSLNVPIDHQNGDIFSIEKTKYLFGEKPFLLNKKKKVKKSYNSFLVKLNFYKENVEDNPLSTCLNIKRVLG